MRKLDDQEVKDILAKLLKKFADICDANNIRYFLAYGTLIGAVRHQGFIPWDDDIDILMPREDYHRVIDLIANSDNPDIEVTSPHTRNGYFTYTKIYDTTTFCEFTGLDYEVAKEAGTEGEWNYGVFLDVYPLDGLPTNKLLSSIHRLRLNLLKRLLWCKVSVTDIARLGGIKAVIRNIIRKCLGFISYQDLNTYINNICMAYPFDESTFVGDITGMYKTLVYEKKWFDDKIELPFERFMYSAPAHYDEILRTWYGDYMTPTPENERLQHPHTVYKLLENYKVDNAIILAAGFGSRFVPLTYETPKGLLKVHGQVMIERQIEQLREQGIDEIILVIGYMKEAFDYLIDKYGVKLIFNPEFAVKNNLASLYVARQYLKNSYILVADNYIERNMYHTYETKSWLSCRYFEDGTSEWCIKQTASGKITGITIGGRASLALMGPAYFTADFSKVFAGLLEEYYTTPGTENNYWEHIVKDHIKTLEIYANDQTGNIHEFESLAELREYDKSYLNDTHSRIMEDVSSVFDVPQSEIGGIAPLKAGMTNQSFIFQIGDSKYVYRLPGPGTDKLIDRAGEKRIYDLISPLGIADEIVSFDAGTGVKITKYYEDARLADPDSDEDLAVCMRMIRELHTHEITSPHTFDIARLIRFYHTLANELGAIRYTDIDDVSEKAEELLLLRKALDVPEILVHADSVHTNMLFLPDGTNRLIDWEYSGSGDPIMDVAMYSIYAYFDRTRAVFALRLYLKRDPERSEEARLYMYMAIGAFLWSLWAEYKQGLGEEFGAYGMLMYRYMKDYYKILHDEGFMDEIMGGAE